MNKTWLSNILVVMLVTLGMLSYSYAGSDRLVMSMSAERMDREDLVYIRFLGSDDSAIESGFLKQMVIREQDCNLGQVLELGSDYRVGYAPENMLVGIYLYPEAWHNKTLCFGVSDKGTVKESLNPTVNNGRSFQLRLVP